MIPDESKARTYVEQFANDEAIEKLDALVTALRAENERQNLVARSSLDSVWRRHIADSAQLLRFAPHETSGSWLDLGVGAGFPGLVIAILCPETPVFLVESRARRIEWLKGQTVSLGLSNCTVLGNRLEKIEAFPVDVISARAFAPLDRLVALSARFSTVRTHWVLPKGRSAAQVVRELPRNIREMFHVEQSLTDREAGIIVGIGRPETLK